MEQTVITALVLSQVGLLAQGFLPTDARETTETLAALVGVMAFVVNLITLFFLVPA